MLASWAVCTAELYRGKQYAMNLFTQNFSGAPGSSWMIDGYGLV